MRTTVLLRSFATLALTQLIIPLHSGLAQESSSSSLPSTFGEIKFEDSNTRDKTYADTVKETAEFFDSFATIQNSLKSGTIVSPVTSLSKDSIFYLSGLYLYCIQKSGVCRLIPDALFEVEVVRGFVKNPASCDSMVSFWEAWREQGMEERAKYVVPMASIRALSDYNEQERPKYLRCNTSVKAELTGAGKDFFTKRYASDTRRATLGKSIAQVIRQLEEKQVNVFLTTGAMGQKNSTAP